MTDNYDQRGVGMTMTRINDAGEVEAIKDRNVEQRMEMIIGGDVAALITRRDECKRQADALKQKAEAESRVFQVRKHYKTGSYVIKNPKLKTMYEMVAAYDRVIASMVGV